MELTGSQIVIECLKEQGVDTVFAQKITIVFGQAK